MKLIVYFITILLIMIMQQYFYWLLFLLPFILLILLFSGLKTIDEENNGKSGYYAEYGTSYGTNADKHKKYLEEKIANEIMK